MPRKREQRQHRGVFERAKGSGIWWIRFVDVDGKRKAKCVGTFGDAVDLYEANRVRIRRGRLADDVPSSSGVKISALCDTALAYSNSRHKDTRNFKQRIEVIRAKFGNRVADSLLPSEVQVWLDGQGWTPGTRNRYRACFSKLLQLGVRDRRVKHNAARDVPQITESAGRLRFLSHEEEEKIRHGLEPCYSQQLDIALNTGMRKGEQFSLGWDEIDFERREVHLSQTKNGSSRTVKLNSVALAALRDVQSLHSQIGLSEDDRLFINSKGVPIADPREWFSSACERAGVKGVTWHTLRHTFASRLVMSGVDLRTVQDLMGHKTQAMTVRYAHLSETHKEDALEKITRKQPSGK